MLFISSLPLSPFQFLLCPLAPQIHDFSFFNYIDVDVDVDVDVDIDIGLPYMIFLQCQVSGILVFISKYSNYIQI